MHCPSCGDQNSKVVDSRLSSNGRSIRRRRECDKCKFRFTTFERMQSSNFVVEKRNGSTEPYDREKVEKGILASCAKRPVSINHLRENLNELEETWGREQIVNTARIGNDIMEMLKGLDEVAFIRFASVYKEFSDIESFREALLDIESFTKSQV